MIRRATEDDLPQLSAIDRQGNPSPWTAGQFRAVLDSPHDCVFLSCGGRGDAAAFIVWRTVLDESELHLIATASKFRRQGRASALLAFWLDAASASGVRRLLLEVRASNTAARSLYRKHGFSDAGCRKAYYPLSDGSREDAVLMEKIC